MKNIYIYVAKDGYAARVQDTKSYDAIRFVDYLRPPCSTFSQPYFQQGHIVKMDVPSGSR